MPSSFSRFLDETELKKVRELYLESLAALDAEDEAHAAEAAVDETPAARPHRAPGATADPAPDSDDATSPKRQNIEPS